MYLVEGFVDVEKKRETIREKMKSFGKSQGEKWEMRRRIMLDQRVIFLGACLVAN